jgi:four helix bundle protein
VHAGARLLDKARFNFGTAELNFGTAGLNFGNGGTQLRNSKPGLKSVTQMRDVGFKFFVRSASSLYDVPGYRFAHMCGLRSRMSFEQMRVYQAAELLDSNVAELIDSIGQGHTKDIDQLRRATASISYNIAEAFGSEHSGQKVYHLGIARGSADETRAVLKKLAKRGALSTTAITRAVVLTVAIAKMLTAWIDKLQ